MSATLPPGPKGMPVLGNMIEFDRAAPELLRRAYQRYGPVFTISLANIPLVWMIGPAANQYILVQNAANFEVRSASALVPLLGEGLLVIDDEQHRTQRALMTPAFHKQRVNSYMETMVASIERAFSRWQPGQTVQIFEEARYVTLDIIARTVFGMDLGSRRDSLRPEIQAMLSFFNLPTPVVLMPYQPPLGPWRRLRQARRRFDQIVGEAVQQRRRDGGDGADILTALVEARDEHGNGLTDQQIADQLTTLLLAGHDTTTGTFAWAVKLLCEHPAVAQRLRAEQQAVLGDRLPTADDLRALPYLEMVVNEVLRLYPPAWLGPRRAREGFSWGGFTIPARTRVAFSQWVTHRLPEYFPDPDSFIPERFDKERGSKLPPFAYIPFGGGARVCIGAQFATMEIKAMLALLIRHWDVSALPGHTVEMRLMPTLQPRNDVLVTVQPVRSLALA